MNIKQAEKLIKSCKFVALSSNGENFVGSVERRDRSTLYIRFENGRLGVFNRNDIDYVSDEIVTDKVAIENEVNIR